MKRESNQEIAKVLDAFTDQVRRETGLECILYVSPAFWKEHLLPAQTTTRTQPLWITEFDAKKARRLLTLPPWTSWQATKKGRIAGIPGPCDRSRGRELDSIRIPATWKSRSKGS